MSVLSNKDNSNGRADIPSAAQPIGEVHDSVE
jgi:hypothetical protein